MLLHPHKPHHPHKPCKPVITPVSYNEFFNTSNRVLVNVSCDHKHHHHHHCEDTWEVLPDSIDMDNYKPLHKPEHKPEHKHDCDHHCDTCKHPCHDHHCDCMHDDFLDDCHLHDKFFDDCHHMHHFMDFDETHKNDDMPPMIPPPVHGDYHHHDHCHHEPCHDHACHPHHDPCHHLHHHLFDRDNDGFYEGSFIKRHIF